MAKYKGTTHFTLKSLLTWISYNKNKVLLGEFPNATYSNDVPQSLIDALTDHLDCVHALNDEIQRSRELYNEMVHGRFKTPTGFIGHPVYKQSGKPFKGGSDTTIVKGIILHPNLNDGSFAFTYDYIDDDSETKESYIRTSMVKPYLTEV